MNLSTRAALAAIYYARRHRTDAPPAPLSARLPHADAPDDWKPPARPETPTHDDECPTCADHPPLTLVWATYRHGWAGWIYHCHGCNSQWRWRTLTAP